MQTAPRDGLLSAQLGQRPTRAEPCPRARHPLCSRNPSAPRSGPQWVFALALLLEEIEARRSRAPGSPRAGREASHPEPCPPAPRSAEGGKEQRSESASRSTDWPAGQSRSGQTPHLTDDRGRGDAPATQAPTHTLAPTILPQPFEGALALPPLRRWASLGTGEPRRRPEATQRVSGRVWTYTRCLGPSPCFGCPCTRQSRGYLPHPGEGEGVGG